MFEYFYNEILRKTIISFGTLFNGLTVKQESSTVKVPLAYGPTQKFLARLEQAPNLSQATQISLPRMSFEFTGLTYDPSRKVTTTQTITVKDADDGTEIKKVYTPVPYNMQFELSIMVKLNDDGLQIIEQILPYFQPQYNLTDNLLSSINEKRDVPVILENITMSDDYEGDYTTRRVLLYTLNFTAKTYLFGPVSSASKDIVKSVSVRYLAGGAKSTERDVTYAVKPRAIKDYTGDVATNLSEDIDADVTEINVDDATAITVKKYIEIEGEELYVSKITGNKLTVKRGQDKTVATGHVRGTDIKGIDYTDNAEGVGVDTAAIEMGDDFGFDGSYS